MDICFLLIDPQRDFCHPNGSLYVPGAEQDMQRVAKMILAIKNKLSKIYLTLDSHRKLDIAHPLWWKNKTNQHPESFTIITSQQVEQGEWMAAIPSYQAKSLAYLKLLKKNSRYPHTIWPEHCLIGGSGHCIDDSILAALNQCEQQYIPIEIIVKGLNPFTEHFSAIGAEVPDINSPDTQKNIQLIKSIESADLVLIAGEAATHCVLNTVEDIASGFENKNSIKKLIWLSDGSSAVPNPPNSTIFSDRLNCSLESLVGAGMGYMSIQECIDKYF